MIETITPHAQLRIKQRATKSKRIVELALERGKKPEDYKGRFRKYLDYLRINHHNGVIVYDNNIFVYNGNKELVTVLKVPTIYLKYM